MTISIQAVAEANAQHVGDGQTMYTSKSAQCTKRHVHGAQVSEVVQSLFNDTSSNQVFKVPNRTLKVEVQSVSKDDQFAWRLHTTCFNAPAFP